MLTKISPRLLSARFSHPESGTPCSKSFTGSQWQIVECSIEFCSLVCFSGDVLDRHGDGLKTGMLAIIPLSAGLLPGEARCLLQHFAQTLAGSKQTACHRRNSMATGNKWRLRAFS